MRNLLACVVLTLCAALAIGQSSVGGGGPTPGLALPDCNLIFSLTSGSPTSTTFDNRSVGCTTWHLQFYGDGSVTTLNLQPEEASNVAGSPGAFSQWPSAQVFGTLPLTAVTQGQVTFSQFFPFVRVNATTLTGAGTVAGRMIGWKAQGSGESSASASPAQGAVAAGKAGTSVNPELWGGISSGNAMFVPLPDLSHIINPSTATTTLLVAAPGVGKNTYISSIEIASTGAQTVKIIDGTQTTNPCDTTPQTLSATIQLVANQDYFGGNGIGTLYKTTSPNRQICAVTSAAVSVFIASHDTSF